MRIRSRKDLDAMGASAQKQVLKLAPELRRSSPARAGVAKIMNDPVSGAKYCSVPPTDPAVLIFQVMVRHFGSWWRGGEVASEMILPGADVAYRFDIVFPRYRFAIEMDGYGYHRSLEAFKRDRHKQKFALTKGWVVHRVTNSDVRESLADMVSDVEKMLRYRNRNDVTLTPKGLTFCILTE